MCDAESGADIAAVKTGAGISTFTMASFEDTPRCTHACTHPVEKPTVDKPNTRTVESRYEDFELVPRNSSNIHYSSNIHDEEKPPIVDVGLRTKKSTPKAASVNDDKVDFNNEKKHNKRALVSSKAPSSVTYGDKWRHDRYERVLRIVKYVQINFPELGIDDEKLSEALQLCSKALRSMEVDKNMQAIDTKALASPNFWAFALIQEAQRRKTKGWEVVESSSVVGEAAAEEKATSAANTLSWENLSRINEKIIGEETNQPEIKYEDPNLGMKHNNNGSNFKRVIPNHSLFGDPKKVLIKFKELSKLISLSGDEYGLHEDIQRVLPPQVLRYNEPEPRSDSRPMPYEAKKQRIEKHSLYSATAAAINRN